MSGWGPVGKWLSILLLTVLAHIVFFNFHFKNKSKEAERIKEETIQIDLDIVEEATVEEPAPIEPVPPVEEPEPESVEEPESPVEEPEPEPEPAAEPAPPVEEPEPEPDPVEIEKEQKLKEELLQKKKLEEIKKNKEAEKRRLEEIARKKKAAELARKKKAKALAAKKAAEALRKKKEAAAKKRAAAKKAAQAKKIAKKAYAKSRRKPVYPKSLLRKGIEGRVKVRVSISAAGRVTNASIYASSGHSSFDKSALKAARKWRYNPSYNGLGQAVPDTKIETIIFKLK